MNCVLIFSSGVGHTDVLLKRHAEIWPEVYLVRGFVGWVGEVAGVSQRLIEDVRWWLKYMDMLYALLLID